MTATGTGSLTDDRDGLVDGDALADRDGDVLAVGCTPPSRTRASTGNQASAIFLKPASFGCTPSPVSLAASNPVHRSATTTGDCAVVSPAAQPGSAALSATTSAGQVAHAAGLIGMICATTTFTAGLFARIWPTSFVNAASFVAVGMYPPHMSFVPRCMRTTSGRAALSHGGSWLLSAIPVAE